MFVLFTGIVHVQCYRGWYVETGNVNTILGKLHKLKYAILTTHNTYLGYTEFARSFQRMERLFGGIGQTAHKLETNAHANFHMAENLAYKCMENGGRNMPNGYFCGSLWLSGTILRQIQAPR